mgnify:CR=1 FL=1
MLTVTFEDRGQDFLEWDIDGDRVVDCRPFQADVWCRVTLLTTETEIEHGTRITFKNPYGDVLTLNYPVTGLRFS